MTMKQEAIPAPTNRLNRKQALQPHLGWTPDLNLVHKLSAVSALDKYFLKIYHVCTRTFHTLSQALRCLPSKGRQTETTNYISNDIIRLRLLLRKRNRVRWQWGLTDTLWLRDIREMFWNVSEGWKQNLSLNRGAGCKEDRENGVGGAQMRKIHWEGESHGEVGWSGSHGKRREQTWEVRSAGCGEQLPMDGERGKPQWFPNWTQDRTIPNTFLRAAPGSGGRCHT